VTLTLKQCYCVNGVVVRLTPLEASQNLTHFLNVINRKSFGKVGVRKGKRVRCFPALEGDGKSVRFHYHLCLDKPEALTIEQFTALIHKTWLKTNFGYYQIDVRPCDDGWISYMTKYRSKSEFADAIDWMNYNNSERAV
jgi:hypothetical protein